MTDRDPSLDMALRLLGSADPATGTEDDARFAKRVAGALGQKKFAKTDLDAALEAPLPDEHRDPATVAHAAQEAEVVEEHDAANAAEDHHGEDPAWDGAISRPPASGPVNALDGLRGLTRSGPQPSIRPASDEIGMAKGPDSGLIDLRSLSQSGEKPIAAGVAEAELARTTPHSPSALKPSAAPATSTSAQARSAKGGAAASTKATKRNVMPIWLGGAGLAAAAAFAIFFVSSKHSDKSPSESQRSADVAEAKANASSGKTSPAATIAATTTEAPTVLASASAAPEEQTSASPDDNGPTDDKLAMGKKPPPKAMTGSGTPAGTKEVTKPTPATTGTTATPKNGNGSLDDVLGLNKPVVPTATVAVTPDLPDKPEAIDVRAAVNGKVPAASSCVAGLSGASKVQISFSPGGTVSGVVVTSGPAKGTGAETCIKNAFSGAKVPRSKMGGTGFASLGS